MSSSSTSLSLQLPRANPNRVEHNPVNYVPRIATKLPSPLTNYGDDYAEAADSLVHPKLYVPPHPSRIRPPAQFKRSNSRSRKPLAQASVPGRQDRIRQHLDMIRSGEAYATEEPSNSTGTSLLSTDVTLRPPILNPTNLANNAQVLYGFVAPSASANGGAQTSSNQGAKAWPDRVPVHPKFAGAPNFTRYENGTPQIQTVGDVRGQSVGNHSNDRSEITNQRVPTSGIALPAHAMVRGIPGLAIIRHPLPAAMATSIRPNIPTTNNTRPPPLQSNMADLCLQITQAVPGLRLDTLMEQLCSTNGAPFNLPLPPGTDSASIYSVINDILKRNQSCQLLRHQQLQHQQQHHNQQQQQHRQPPQQPQYPQQYQYSQAPLPQQQQFHNQKPNMPIPSTTAASMQNVVTGVLPPPRPQLPTEDDMVRQDREADADDDEEFNEAETYADYVPSKVKIGHMHPDPVVETSSLATAPPPDPTYELKLPEKIINQALLSALQLESVTYACQQHMEKLPDGKTRRGFLIGDGAGVGKGRTIAGIIYENHLNGRKKSIWLSVSTDLKLDAERDLKDIGAKIPVFLLGKFAYGRRINEDHGVMFTTYSGLISKSQSIKGQYGSRMSQLVSWAGNNFDGVVVFDECHKAKNITMPGKTSKKLSKAAEFVLELQEKLPNARIVYASATGATETRHLGYMTRLGIWGPGSPYPTFPYFCDCIEKRGVGGMELVAVELKMRGAYMARQLSFKTCSFEIQRAPLTNEFIQLYDACVDMWALAFKHFREAECYFGRSKKLGRLWSSFWAAHQKFFKYLCISLKVPLVVEIAKKAIEDDKCVVIGLQSTGEAKTLEALEDGEINEFISTARATFESLIENHFPAPTKTRRRRRVSASTDSDIIPGPGLLSDRSCSSSGVDDNWARDQCKFFVRDGVTLPVIQESSKPRNSLDAKQRALQELVKAKRANNKSARALRAKRRSGTTLSRIKKVATDSDTEISNPLSTSSSDRQISDDEDFLIGSSDSETETVTESEGSDDDLKVVGTKSAKQRKSRKIIDDDSEDEIQITAVKNVVTIVSDSDLSDEDQDQENEDADAEVDPMVEHGPRLMAMQEELLNKIDELGPRLPHNTLDDLIDRLGGPERVAEMTGRKGRVVKDDTGQISYRARNEIDVSEVLNIEEKKRFMDGKKLVAIISEAASSGISLQADRRVKNQKRRVHITIELPWSADRAIQQFGRTHRSNQISGPEYVFVISELSGETRFASIVAKRLESLGALTHGDRRATMEQRDLSQFNIAGKYTKKALENINTYLESSRHVGPIILNYQGNFIRDARQGYLATGLGKLTYGDIFSAEPVSMNINIFLNRILGMKVRVQNAMFELFSQHVDRLYHHDRVNGVRDSRRIYEITCQPGITVEPAETMTIKTLGSYISCSMRRIQIERGITWERAKEYLDNDTGGDSRSGFYVCRSNSCRSKWAILAIREGVDLFRIYKPNMGRLPKPDYYSNIRDKFVFIAPEKAERIWRYTYEATDKYCIHLSHFANCKRMEALKNCDVGLRHRKYCILSGAIMTIWPYLERKVPEATRRLDICRLKLDDNTKEIGPLIPLECVDKVKRVLKEAEVTGIEWEVKKTTSREDVTAPKLVKAPAKGVRKSK